MHVTSKVKANAAHGVRLCECVCKLQYNSFSIPLAADGQRAKTSTIPPAFDTQITSITSSKNFTFNLCFHF